jgi:hypothetical protein
MNAEKWTGPIGRLWTAREIEMDERYIISPWMRENIRLEQAARDAAAWRPRPPKPAEPEPVAPAFVPDANLPPDAQATQVLLHVLPESGEPVPATAVAEAAKRYGIARRALKKAQSVLRIRPKKTTTGWTWALPRDETA